MDMDEGRRIRQEAIFSWERREEIGRQEGIQEGIQRGIQQGIQRGIQQGIQQGSEKKGEQIAKKMLAKGFEIGTICNLTDLTPDELEQLRNRLD